MISIHLQAQQILQMSISLHASACTVHTYENVRVYCISVKNGMCDFIFVINTEIRNYPYKTIM